VSKHRWGGQGRNQGGQAKEDCTVVTNPKIMENRKNLSVCVCVCVCVRACALVKMPVTACHVPVPQRAAVGMQMGGLYFFMCIISKYCENMNCIGMSKDGVRERH